MSDIKLKHESSIYWAIKALEDMGANGIDRCAQETNFIYGHVVTMAHEINEFEEELTKASDEIKRLREIVELLTRHHKDYPDLASVLIPVDCWDGAMELIEALEVKGERHR